MKRILGEFGGYLTKASRTDEMGRGLKENGDGLEKQVKGGCEWAF